MTALKIYTVELRDSLLLPAAIEAIGDEPHHRQADVYVVAPTKKVALEMLQPVVRASQRTTYVASGNSIDALLLAGWLQEEGQILVVSANDGRGVANHLGDGSYQRIGKLDYVEGAGAGQVFIPVIRPKSNVDLDDSRHPAWTAVAEVAGVEAVAAAIRADNPEWEVTELIERAVRAALAVPR